MVVTPTFGGDFAVHEALIGADKGLRYCLFPGYGIFESFPDESLIRNTPRLGTVLHRLKQRLWHSHVDSRLLLLELEPNRFCTGKIIICREISEGAP
jgi:hypothetical protein